MNQTAVNYAKALFLCNPAAEDILHLQTLLERSEVISQFLCCPAVSFDRKKALITALFPKTLQGFLIVVCYHERAHLLGEMLLEYEKIKNRKDRLMIADLTFVGEFKALPINQIVSFLRKRFQMSEVVLHKKKEEALMAGYVISYDHIEFDFSARNLVTELENKLIKR